MNGFRILVSVLCGEGIQRYQSPPGHEDTVFAAVEQAAQEIVDNYGQGLVITEEGKEVMFV